MNQLEDFRALGLSDDILTVIAKKGFETPSAIQSLTIPHLLSTDKDIIAQAQTGTGKTAAFGLPIIQMLEKGRLPQAIVLVPTRELALQVTGELQSFNTGGLSIAPIYGGASIEEQLRRLKKGIDIVVGTPGRILDHIRRRTLDLSGIAYLVLDEADEMLNMGFIEDIEAIMQEMTSPKRVLLFSATMPDRIAALAQSYMHDPDILKVETQYVTTDLTNQIYFEVREGDKLDALTRIIDVEPDFYGIVFARTRVGTDDIVSRLIERGYAAEGLHGDISQAQREKILGKFRKKQINILVATDVAARGIDIVNLTHVINYSLPQDSDSYVHRIGRTGRAGQHGTAITFISPSEMRKFGFLKKDIKADIKLEQLPTPADVIATKRNRIKEDLYTIVESENYLECGDMAAELLEIYSPEVALGALLRLAFKDELSENSYPEIRSINVDRRGKTRIFIAVGWKEGYDPRKLVKLLKRECGLSDHDIDDVKVMEDFSFVTVPFDAGSKVVRALNMLSGGRPIAEIAKDKSAENGLSPAPKRRKKSEAEGAQPVAKPRKKAAKSSEDWDVAERPEWTPRKADAPTPDKSPKPRKEKTTHKSDAPRKAETHRGYDFSAFFEEQPMRKRRGEDSWSEFDKPSKKRGDNAWSEFDRPSKKKASAGKSSDSARKPKSAKPAPKKTSRREKKETRGRR
jgi:ATP-dependent RNA helicase DeaD